MGFSIGCGLPLFVAVGTLNDCDVKLVQGVLDHFLFTFLLLTYANE